MDERRPGSSRRAFLRRAGLLAAVAATPSALAGCNRGGNASPGDDTSAASAPAAGGDAVKIGLLVPLSGVFASLGEDLRNGFELYLHEHGGTIAQRSVELVVEDSEANPEVGLRKAQKLLREDRVAIVSGVVHSAVALGIRDLFHEAKVPLVVSNAGANDITRGAASPYIFRTSFSNWQTTYSLGRWFAENVATEAFALAPDYTAGMEMIEGFRESFTAAGGTIVDEARSPFGTTQDFQPYLSQARTSGAPAVFAFYAGAEAISFVQQYRDFGLKDTVALLGPGFLTDDGVLRAQGDAALGIRTSLHYSPLLDNPVNERFAQGYRERFNETPTVYAVQSYDAAQLIAAALEATGGDADDTAAVAEAMAAAGPLDSPRGRFSLDPQTHNPVQPFYLREVRRVEDGLGNVVVGDLGEFRDPG